MPKHTTPCLMLNISIRFQAEQILKTKAINNKKTQTNKQTTTAKTQSNKQQTCQQKIKMYRYACRNNWGSTNTSYKQSSQHNKSFYYKLGANLCLNKKSHRDTPYENLPPTLVIARAVSSNSHTQITIQYLKEWSKGIENHILCPQPCQSVTYNEFLKTHNPICSKHSNEELLSPSYVVYSLKIQVTYDMSLYFALSSPVEHFLDWVTKN